MNIETDPIDSIGGESEGDRSIGDRLVDAAKTQTSEFGMAACKDARLSAEEIERARMALPVHLDKFQITLAQAARQIGYGAPTVSEWLKGTYKGDNEKVARRVLVYMETDLRRRAVARPASGGISTWCTEQLLGTFQHAIELACMAAVVAPAGAGKSHVMQIITERCGGILFSGSKGMTGQGICREIARQAGWKRLTYGTRTELLQFITQQLSGTRRPILVDEAHQLGQHIGWLRTIHDNTGCPVLMAGAAEILDLVDDRRDGAGQFSSRTMRRNLLDALRTAGRPDGKGGRCKVLFTRDEIAKFIGSMRIRIDREGLDMTWRLACLPSYGTLRLVQHLLATLATLGVETVTRDDLLSALDTWVGPGEAGVIVMQAEVAIEDRPIVAAKAG